MATREPVTQICLPHGDGRVARLVAAHDVGRAVNPALCRGQIEASLQAPAAEGIALFPLRRPQVVCVGPQRHPVDACVSATPLRLRAASDGVAVGSGPTLDLLIRAFIPSTAISGAGDSLQITATFVGREHQDRIHPTFLEPAPDLAVEVVSQRSTKRDHFEKFAEYDAARRDENWIIEPRRHA